MPRIGLLPVDERRQDQQRAEDEGDDEVQLAAGFFSPVRESCTRRPEILAGVFDELRLRCRSRETRLCSDRLASAPGAPAS
jgi:hypothetical protein